MPELFKKKKMVHSIPTPKTVSGQTFKRYVTPSISLERTVKKTLGKDECLTFKLRSVPADENSTTYELTIGFFKSGTPEELLLFLQNLRKIFTGQNVTTGPNRYAIARRLLQGDALAAFNRAAAAAGTETVENFRTCVEELKKHVFPRKALSSQKRYMRRFLRKPRDMPIREFVTRLVEINELLVEFPPSGPNNKLPMDELMDIVEFAVPATWQRAMVMHDFDPMIHTPQDVISFCERIEFAEGTNQKEAKPQTDSKNGKGGLFRAKSSERGISDKSSSTTRKRGAKWCEYHQTESHDTGDCKVILAQVKRMRGQYQAFKANDPKYRNFKQEQKFPKKEKSRDNYSSELRDFIKHQVREALKMEKLERENQPQSDDEGEHFNLEEFQNISLSDSDDELIKESKNISDTLENYSLLPRVMYRDRRSDADEAQIDDPNLAPIAFGRIRTALGKIKETRLKNIKILFDSGASETIITKQYINPQKLKRTSSQQWNTAAGKISTNYTAKILFNLPEFNETKVIQCHAHVFDTKLNYDMIIGRDLMSILGIKMDFQRKTVNWMDIEIPMKNPNCQFKDFFVQESDSVKEAMERIKGILDAKYEPANLDEVVEQSTHLNYQEKQMLRKLLEKYKNLFDGTLGQWKDEILEIELKEGIKPYHARAFPIPKIHETTLKMEVDRLVQQKVLKRVNRSEWAAPTFIIPKKDGSVRFISDFRELNKRIKRKPYPIPKIQDLLLRLEGFTYGTSLDLNMGYYHIELSPNSKKLCTIILPWGKYEYQRLPMGLCNSPDIFQEKMSTLFQELEYVRAYIDDLLIITKNNFKDHIEKLDKVFNKLQNAGLKVNAKKSFFARGELEYLGYWITRKGIQPIPKKVEAIKNLAIPKNTKEVRRLVGMINYYRDMWAKRSELLAPLTELCSKKAKFIWTDKQQKAFEAIKQTISKDTLLSYPNFNEEFIIHTDASDYQLGAVISQNNKPIAFYSRKLSPAQTRYTTTERELLAIVETLKEFRNILLGHKITVYTDHENLTYKNFNTNRVMRWRLLLEEYGPKLIYLKGEKNVVADALSRLPLENNNNEFFTDNTYENIKISNSELLNSENDMRENFPLRLKTIMRYQQNDNDLLTAAKNDATNNYHLKTFRGGGKQYSLLCYSGKIVIPKALQKKIVEWYHVTLLHPGETRTELTIRQHFTWKGLRNTVIEVCKNCETCQKTKRSNKKYGHLPPKTAETIPWEKLCVDMIGPYTITNKETRKTITLHCVTMIDPATGWFEMTPVEEKEALTVADAVERTWLCRYPWPQEIIYDRGTEFLGEFGKMIEYDYGIKKRPITVRNPQANAILERAHQTIGNMLRTVEIHKDTEVSKESLNGIINAILFAMHATVHTTLQATPMQLVFNRDAIMNIQFLADWKFIQQRKQKLINQNNQKENSKRIPHEYKIGDKVLMNMTDITKSKYGSNPFDGPYTVRRVNDNGTLVLEMGPILDTVNIRNVKPFKRKYN